MEKQRRAHPPGRRIWTIQTTAVPESVNKVTVARKSVRLLPRQHWAHHGFPSRVPPWNRPCVSL